MKLSKSEYEALIRKHPNLRPTEAIKSQNTHKSFLEAANECLESKGVHGPIVQENLVKSPRTLKFTIPGQPVGKPRMSQRDKWQKRPCVMRYRAWADKARESLKVFVPEAFRVMNVVVPGVEEVSFIAYLEFPKSYSKKKIQALKGSPHFQKPDVDNILKAICDALFKEDKSIWKISGEKRWNDGQGARIEVELK